MKTLIQSLILSFLFILVFLWVQGSVKTPPVPVYDFYFLEAKEANRPYEKPYKKLLVDYFSEKYGVLPELVNCLIERESGFNEFAIGDQGQAVGLIQAHPYFWRAYRQRMGEDIDLSLRTNPVASIETMCYVLSKGGESNWTTFKYCQRKL
jgi:soluble lytic murein transglycosylase-like protein